MEVETTIASDQTDLVSEITEYFKSEWLLIAMKIIGVIVIGYILIKIISALTLRLFKKKLTPQSSMIIKKTFLYGGIIFICIYIFRTLGLELTPLLGAAGIVGIAVGFASQTSISNLISGLFLISEKPFAIGDVICVGTTTGVILSIDLLSVKLRTFDNRFVRIPNETILNNELTNMTRFPIRRLDIEIGVAYKENTRRVCKVLKEVADNNPYCLVEPEPLILFKNFGNSSLDFLVGLWVERPDFLKLKKSIMDEIKERFDQEGIEFPFPHLSLYTGSATTPFPVKVIHDEEKT